MREGLRLASAMKRLVCDPRAAARRGYTHMPSFPISNRAAAGESLHRRVDLPGETLALDTSIRGPSILALDHTSELHQRLSNRARAATRAAFDRLLRGAHPRSEREVAAGQSEVVAT